jgi:hypothetical protein
MEIEADLASTEVVGIPWFLQPDYEQTLAMMLDSASLPDSYQEWLEAAETLERQIRAGGRSATRAIIDPFEFSIWCRDMSTKPDATAREQFAAWVVAHRHAGY